jgi:peptidoglycan/xylan/chitin deacetylase (PgdA/CDA1 family)
MRAIALVGLVLFAAAHTCFAGCITQLPSQAVALTYDACETVTPSYFDETILACLLGERIPFTLFVSGLFAWRNSDRLKEIAGLPFVEIENHSFHHYLHMERLPDETVQREVSENDDLIRSVIGRGTRYFRFPGGNCNARVIRVVEGMRYGHVATCPYYRVVHWTFASGDSDRRETPEILTRWVLAKTQPGSILIFHINGRGWSTGRALPGIIHELRKRGYTFVKIEDALKVSLPDDHPR